MKAILLIVVAILLMSARAVSAECFFRSAVDTKANGKLSMVSDVRNWITPAVNGQKKCIATFKVLDEINRWHNGTGEYVFSPSMSDETGCNLAIERGKLELINQIYGSSISSAGEMVCDETPLPQTRPVIVGEVIQVSDVSPHPTKPPFKYKGAYCRWFVETSVSEKELYQWQGIICKTGRPGIDTWTVVDKF